MLEEKAKVLQARLLKERSKYQTDGEFADAIGGIKSGTLNRWLNANPPVWPDDLNLGKIANYFKADIDELTRVKNPLRVKEKFAGYSIGDVEQCLESIPLKEQVTLALRILDKAKDAIA
jgi:hypothetical protein